MLHAYITVLNEAADIALYSFRATERAASGEVDEDTREWGWGMPALRGLRDRERYVLSPSLYMVLIYNPSEGRDFVSELRDIWADANRMVFTNFKAFVSCDPEDSAVLSDIDDVEPAGGIVQHVRGDVSADESDDDVEDEEVIEGESDDGDGGWESDENDIKRSGNRDGGVWIDDKDGGAVDDDKDSVAEGDDEDGGVEDNVED